VAKTAGDSTRQSMSVKTWSSSG